MVGLSWSPGPTVVVHAADITGAECDVVMTSTGDTLNLLMVWDTTEHSDWAGWPASRLHFTLEFVLVRPLVVTASVFTSVALDNLLACNCAAILSRGDDFFPDWVPLCDDNLLALIGSREMAALAWTLPSWILSAFTSNCPLDKPDTATSTPDTLRECDRFTSNVAVVKLFMWSKELCAFTIKCMYRVLSFLAFYKQKKEIIYCLKQDTS